MYYYDLKHKIRNKICIQMRNKDISRRIKYLKLMKLLIDKSSGSFPIKYLFCFSYLI